jgi:hypothetical protein
MFSVGYGLGYGFFCMQKGTGVPDIPYTFDWREGRKQVAEKGLEEGAPWR